jgi:Kef-type K+ transport system membrane component KefB
MLVKSGLDRTGVPSLVGFLVLGFLIRSADASFMPLYDLFSPFFFIGIGLDIDPRVIGKALGMGGILLFMAILGKLLADGISVSFIGGINNGILIGASMVPRAEIAMVIMQIGLRYGEWAVQAKAYAAMVVVSAATCILSPPAVQWLLKKQFRKGEVS